MSNLPYQIRLVHIDVAFPSDTLKSLYSYRIFTHKIFQKRVSKSTLGNTSNLPPRVAL